jgi:hypothetical protein
MELSRRRALQFRIIQHLQEEGEFFYLGYEHGIERVLWPRNQHPLTNRLF